MRPTALQPVRNRKRSLNIGQRGHSLAQLVESLSAQLQRIGEYASGSLRVGKRGNDLFRLVTRLFRLPTNEFDLCATT
ncbi:MAG: hypothetical protein ABI580_06890 [Burkholderiaceae bacterium]